MKFDRFIGDLRRRIGVRRKIGKPEDFVDLAAGELARLELHRRIDPRELLQVIVSDGGIAAQFGAEEVIPLHEDGRHGIYAHFWIDRIASPHTHNWYGAFQVLSGTSIHAEHAFDERGRIDADLRFGRLRVERAGVLGPGDVRPVHAFLPHIHSIFHIDRPSVSLSVRRNAPRSAEKGTLDCWAPGLAVKTVWSSGVIDARRKSLDVIARTEPASYDAALEALIRRADLRTLFFALDHGVRKHTRPERLRRVVLAQRPRLGVEVATVLAAAEEGVRTRWFERARSRVRVPDHRFFLGLLCVCRDREGIFELIRQRHPDADPVALLTRWLRELTSPASGSSPSPLELSLSEDTLLLFEQLLRRRAPRSARGSGQDAHRPAASPAELRACERAFRRLRVLLPLFTPRAPA